MQLTRILAAVDDTASGRQALRSGAALVVAADAYLTVVTLVEDPERRIHSRELQGCWRLRLGSFADVRDDPELGRLQREFDVAIDCGRVAHRVAYGAVGAEIVRCAESDGADLIVVGREAGASFMRRRTEGAIAGTLRGARVPCLLVPPGACRAARVLAAVDADPASADVLAAAFALADVWESEVVVLNVEPPLADRARPRVETMRRAQLLAHAVAADAPCAMIARQGEPVREILRAAQEERADLVAIGYRRGSPADRPMSGSVTPRVLRRASCAVLAVPLGTAGSA